MPTHSSILAWRIPVDRGAWWAAVYGVAQSRTRLSDFTFTKNKFKKKFDAFYTVEWASLIAQLVKNLPAMQEIPVRFLGLEESLEKG